ncbi:hypothetical protein L6R49_17045, partial [Myxococcota bacterium]|nr:hypothetical protein [Myxococcota bacterium]
ASPSPMKGVVKPLGARPTGGGARLAAAGKSVLISPWEDTPGNFEYTRPDPYYTKTPCDDRLGLPFILHYGTVHACFDKTWVMAYTDDETRWSDATEALDTLWPEFRAALSAADIDWAALHETIDCWQIPTTGVQARYLFWRDGHGAPHRYFLNALAMVQAYHKHANGGRRGESYKCDGLDDFLAALDSGKNRKNMQGVKGQVRFNVRGSDSLITTQVGPFKTGWFQEQSFLVTDTCSQYTPSCLGGDWDMWDGLAEVKSANEPNGNPAWNTNIKGMRSLPRGVKNPEVLPDGASDGSVERCGSLAYASASSWQVNFHAVTVAWWGMVADFLLFYARMALDYVRDGRGGQEYIDDVAVPLARQVLTMLSDTGWLLIHEIGHIYMGKGTGHCNTECCFETASRRWQCKVRGALGLYNSGVYLDHMSPGWLSSLQKACSTDDRAAMGHESCEWQIDEGTYTCFRSSTCYVGPFVGTPNSYGQYCGNPSCAGPWDDLYWMLWNCPVTQDAWNSLALPGGDTNPTYKG